MSTNHILVLAPNWLGDAAMATPAFRALRQRFPGARITVAGRRGTVSLLEGLPYVDALEPLPVRPGLGRLLSVAQRLRPMARDLVVVLPHSFRAALLARLTGARRRLGYDRGGRRWLLSDTEPPNRVNGRIEPVYMAREYLDLLRPLGCVDDGQGLELHADEGLGARLAAKWAGEGPLVGFAPGAAFGSSKRWPAERYAAVADALRERMGARCVLLTGPDEADTREAVLSAARHPLLEPASNSGGGVDVLKAALSLLDLLIGNDSGPRHIAIAFKVPVICVMGAIRPVYSTGPYERGYVLRTPVYCGPCQQPTCATDHRCMLRIRPEDAVARAEEVLTHGARPVLESLEANVLA
ncbi:MAG: lipopolysaccharide heptosyltransferase II [Candidatus Hydrogenedentota bacterium]